MSDPIYRNAEIFEDPFTIERIEQYVGLCDGCEAGKTVVVAILIPVGSNSVSVPFVCANCLLKAEQSEVIGEQPD